MPDKQALINADEVENKNETIAPIINSGNKVHTCDSICVVTLGQKRGIEMFAHNSI